ncbi:hypothetical protein JCM5353_008514 [Sporobolomyces roseus]
MDKYEYEVLVRRVYFTGAPARCSILRHPLQKGSESFHHFIIDISFLVPFTRLQPSDAPMTPYLRYCPSLSRYVPSSRPFNLLQRYSLPSSSPLPPPPTFETLASDTTIQPGLQAPTDRIGSRQGRANAGNVKVETPTERALLEQANQKKGRIVIAGIELPLKPNPPEEGVNKECCMSGCAHCVYDLYLEDIEHYHGQIASFKSLILNETLPSLSQEEQEMVRRDWPVEIFGEFGEREREGEGAKEKAERELRETRKALDPATRAFLEMEEKIKKKQSEKKS